MTTVRKYFIVFFLFLGLFLDRLTKINMETTKQFLLEVLSMNDCKKKLYEKKNYKNRNS